MKIFRREIFYRGAAVFDLLALENAVICHGRIARVVIAAFDGSSPREVGAAMLVWRDGQSGTIGGGALEWQATALARDALASGQARLDRHALGPALGQCCGGVVTLLTEVYDAPCVAGLDRHLIARPMPGTAATRQATPLAVARAQAGARGQGLAPAPGMVHGWMIEPVLRPQRQIWVWGAGHVGRAIVGVMAPLPGIAITWVDTCLDRFPAALPACVRALPVADPALAVSMAPKDAEHIVLTYSHALDLDLCHRLLIHGFARAGVIGSATKWARFRTRLGALGHAPQSISRIDCPIGDPGLGKHPQCIAVGVAAAHLAPARTADAALRQENLL